MFLPRLPFIRHRIVVDAAEVGVKINEFGQQMQRMQAHLEGVPFVTDVDLRIIRERIETTPDTHRIALGLATLFGFPREMFVGKENLKARLNRLAEAMNSLQGDYIVWLNEQAAAMAMSICDTGEVMWTVRPFARQA